MHGNGPQVGNLAIQQDEAGAHGPRAAPAPALRDDAGSARWRAGPRDRPALRRRYGGGGRDPCPVDPDDPAFEHPTKPIGPFFSAERAAELARHRGWQVVEDSGRGYRRVVASPAPIGIVEEEAIRTLLDAGHVVLAAGGGGIAVSRATDGALTGVDAVIDKDHSAAVAGVLDRGSRALPADWRRRSAAGLRNAAGTPRAPCCRRIEAAQYLAQGQFPDGSMGPKVAAALRFLRDGGAARLHHLCRSPRRCGCG